MNIELKSLHDVLLFVRNATNKQLKEQAENIANVINALPDDEREKAYKEIDCLLGWDSFDR